jgi:hypothetical protein
MREPAERVEVDSRRIGTELMGEVQSFVDGQEEGVVEVDQWMMRGEGERKQMAMQSEEATADADAEVEIVVVVAVEVVVVVDKNSSESDQRSRKDGCNVEYMSGKGVERCVNFKFAVTAYHVPMDLGRGA